ncbi:hypothetical protein G6O69_24720 [Pseudenhygromyxa sp. WMMC2535]|nr:hypothetical protein [Pseudenhygromyxa sp. WMMC2535]
MVMLTGVYHLGRRKVQRLLGELFHIQISLGALSAMEARASAALKPAFDEAKAEAERAASVRGCMSRDRCELAAERSRTCSRSASRLARRSRSTWRPKDTSSTWRAGCPRLNRRSTSASRSSRFGSRASR